MTTNKLATQGTMRQRFVAEPAKEVPMNPLNVAGSVTLNAEGRQYAASYQLRRGVITVTFGSASRVIRVGEAVAAPASLARTILRTMVRENGQRADLTQGFRNH